MQTIFVQIASYRDPELVPTIKDCLQKAKHPERLTFGICWQKDKEESLEGFEKDSRFQIVEVPYEQSKGACWARHQINNLYKGEDFTLQIDSHMRFIENWDEEILNIWTAINDSRAILTTYPAEYYPDKPKSEWKHAPHIIHTYSIKNGHTEQRPKTQPNWEQRKTPYKAIHVAAGFMFGPGELIKDVPYDPEFYFSGEETALAVRLFTHGYNLYHPHTLILWHYYGRKEQPKHWSDDKNWGTLANTAKERLDCLLKRNSKFDLGKYGLGTKRTLEDFQNYSGIDYKRCVLHLDTMDAKEPPVDLSDAKKWSYEKKQFKQILKWDYEKLDKCEDPRFWAFIIKDQNDHELYRKDVTYKENPDLINGVITELELEFEYYTPAQIPSTLLIWPYSESKTWLSNHKWQIQLS